MRIVSSIEDLNLLRKEVSTIAFVPTMGYLHEGHLSLVKLAKQYADTVVMSIYVNPTQFNSKEDLVNYPRDLKRDSSLAKEVGVSVLFVPRDEDMYPSCCGGNALDDPASAGRAIDGGEQTSVTVKAGSLSKGLCGAYREGHFDGVVLVVSKLFNMLRPDYAIFGEKDFQQLRVIEQLVRDLCYPIEIVAAPVMREQDGLAMSSRNVRLSLEDRASARKISQALFHAQSLCASGQRDVETILSQVSKLLNEMSNSRVEYLELVDPQTLRPLQNTINKSARLLVAVWVGQVRLIDNVALEP